MKEERALKKEKRGLSRLRLPEKSVWMQKAHKRLYFVAQAQKEDLSKWSFEAWSYYLSLFYDAAVSGQAIYSRLCRWRETADLGRDHVFLQTLAEDMYGYFVPFMRRWWDSEKCFDPDDNLKTLPPEQIWYVEHEYSGYHRLGWLFPYCGDFMYRWDCVEEVLEGFVEDAEEQAGWYGRLDWVEPEAHRMYLARMLESWLRVYEQYKEAVEGVWHSYVGRWGWLYWGRIVWGYMHLLGVSYRLCGGLGSLVWSQKVLGGYNWHVRGIDLHTERVFRENERVYVPEEVYPPMWWYQPDTLREGWTRVVCPVGKDLSGYVGRLVVPQEDVDWCLANGEDWNRSEWLTEILEARLGWLWSELSGLWGGWLLEEHDLGNTVCHLVETVQQVHEYYVGGQPYRERFLFAGHLDEESIQQAQEAVKDPWSGIYIDAHVAITFKETLTLGAGLLWLSGRIEGLDWGSVGWYEEEAGEPLEAWGWKLGGWLSEGSRAKLGKYHGALLGKFRRYEGCLGVVCGSRRMGEVLVGLLELYGLTLEFLGTGHLMAALKWLLLP